MSWHPNTLAARRSDQYRPSRPARRFYPRSGRALTLANIRGPWRPSGAVASAGVFAVVWSTATGEMWAPLHDFAPADQLRLIEACRVLDQECGGRQWGGPPP